jgi:hypothetical protein
MLELLTDAPEGVIAVKAVGTLTAEDYRDVLDPVVEEVLAEHDGLRAVIVLGPEWDGMTVGAVWQDLRIGLGKISKWQRCAVVTDRDWVEHAMKAFAWIEPGDVKTFELDDLDDAMTWAAADAD